MALPPPQVAVPFSVLLLEPDAERRDKLVRYIESADLDAILCQDLDEALTILEWHRSSVAVVGPTAEGGLALETAGRLRRQSPGLRVILLGNLSSRPERDDSKAWLHLAPADNPQALVLILHRLLNHHLLEALAAREDRYCTLLDTTSSVFVQLTENLRIQDWNPAAEELHGYRRGEVLGRSYVDLFVPASSRPRVAAALEEVLAGGVKRSFESPARVREGSIHTVLWNITRLDHADGALGLLAIGQDITARKRLEGALREAQRLQRQITETVPEHIALYDLETRRTIYSNRRLASILGYEDRQQLQTRFLPDLIYGDDPQGFEALLARLAEEAMVTSKHSLPQRDGSSRLLLARHVVFARDEEGRVRQVLSMLQDVTESERTKEKLRELAQHLQSARDEERAGIAREIHDQLGQELTALKIHMSVLKRAAPALDPALAESFETASNLVASTIETARRISRDWRPRPTAHLGLIPAIRWHVDAFERDCGIPCRFITELKTVKLELERETHVFRILQEALTNVARHAEASSVEIELAQKDGFLMLTIADDGRGISEDVISTGRSIGMTGMRERAHLCGGELKIFCAPGTGTILITRVPLSEADADPKTGAIFIGPQEQRPEDAPASAEAGDAAGGTAGSGAESCDRPKLALE